MKKINIFGKSIPAAIVALLVMSTFGAAALLTYYGQITTTVNVEQSILLDGEPWNYEIIHTIPEAAPGGEEFCFKHTLENKMSVEGEVVFETTEYIGIITGMYNIPEITTLILYNK